MQPNTTSMMKLSLFVDWLNNQLFCSVQPSLYLHRHSYQLTCHSNSHCNYYTCKSAKITGTTIIQISGPDSSEGVIDVAAGVESKKMVVHINYNIYSPLDSHAIYPKEFWENWFILHLVLKAMYMCLKTNSSKFI